MTGFGQARVDGPGYQIEVNVRSVNGRFLESRFHLPKEYFAFEGRLKESLQKFVSRGNIDIFVTRNVHSKFSKAQLVLNSDLASSYQTSILKLAKSMGYKNLKLHPEFLVRLPEVISLRQESRVFPQEQKFLFIAFEKAIKSCVKERLREGSSLKNELKKLVSLLKVEIQKITKLREQANLGLQEKLEQKFKSRSMTNGIDPQRLAQELAILVEKSDINEEIIRLQEHLKNYLLLIEAKSSEGKRLDFYTQELLREVNTIGSKSQLSELIHSVVQAKSVIEKLREQVQNIE